MFWWWAKGSREAASDGPTVLHCKGDWLAIHVFVALMPTHIPPVKKKKKKMLFCLCHCYSLFRESLCLVVPLKTTNLKHLQLILTWQTLKRRRKWFSRSVASNVNHLFLRNMLHRSTSIGLCCKNHTKNLQFQVATRGTSPDMTTVFLQYNGIW